MTDQAKLIKIFDGLCGINPCHMTKVELDIWCWVSGYRPTGTEKIAAQSNTTLLLDQFV